MDRASHGKAMGNDGPVITSVPAIELDASATLAETAGVRFDTRAARILIARQVPYFDKHKIITSSSIIET